ncbi:MAG TPA: D-arabinono-1,4-lactone oxidase, partial [Rhizomicrobium sp.]|nr:D-arabinono-1,4-lactone oxidase [Rhizomicrobium sp.]
FLAVLKRMGNGRAGYLSFPMRGYTLALDFPNRPGIRELHDRLVGITLQHGGRIYLAKDALLSAAAFRAMYPEQDKFRAVLQSVDPRHVMQSDMARRLGLTS